MRRPHLLVSSLAALIAVVASSLGIDPLAAHQDTPRRIVAIGDVHGADQNFAAILKKAGIIDDQGRWIAGKTILVQTGDMSDRGRGMRAGLDLLMSLEKQASDAGGRVHALLGNHEMMNLVGETRDATPEIFETFGGEEALREAFGPRGRYGRWLRSKPVIAKVGDSVFMHAGINPDFDEVSIDGINRRARREMSQWDDGVKMLVDRQLVAANPKFLAAVEAARLEAEKLASSALRNELDTQRTIARLAPLANIGTSSLFSPDGPLWYRGFASWSDEEGADRIDAILKKLRAKRFVTGHTVTRTRLITERFGGRLFLIDTGMLGPPSFPNGRASALEIVGDTTRPLYLE
ncbi:MAG TPA: metallophosphoesterase [Vicinamibacterales bacterium]